MCHLGTYKETYSELCGSEQFPFVRERDLIYYTKARNPEFRPDNAVILVDTGQDNYQVKHTLRIFRVREMIITQVKME